MTDITSIAFWIFVRRSEIFSWELNPLTPDNYSPAANRRSPYTFMHWTALSKVCKLPIVTSTRWAVRCYRVQNGNFKETFDLQLGLYQGHCWLRPTTLNSRQYSATRSIQISQVLAPAVCLLIPDGYCCVVSDSEHWRPKWFAKRSHRLRRRSPLPLQDHRRPTFMHWTMNITLQALQVTPPQSHKATSSDWTTNIGKLLPVSVTM